MIHLGEDYQGRFHMEIYICYIYIYFFCKSHKSAANPAGQEREYLQKGSGSSFSCHVNQVCSCCCWILAGGKKTEKKRKEKNVFKKDKVKRRALFFSFLLSFLPCLPSALPPCLLLSFRHFPAELSFLESLGSSRLLNRIGGLGALGPAPLNQTHSPAFGHLSEGGQKHQRCCCPPEREVLVQQVAPDTAVRTPKLPGSTERQVRREGCSSC